MAGARGAGCRPRATKRYRRWRWRSWLLRLCEDLIEVEVVFVAVTKHIKTNIVIPSTLDSLRTVAVLTCQK